MNPATFLSNVQRIVTGWEGFKRQMHGINLHSWKTTAGLTLAASTAPTMANTETHGIAVVSASSTTDMGALQFMVPRDYDATIDKMYIRFLANSAGTTNAPTIDAALYRKRAGAALSSDLNPTISAAVNKTSATLGAKWIEITAEGLGLEPGDATTWVFTASTHTTDALNVYAIEVVYFSDLAYYEESER
jgi:hypothetical protein